jgi:hypothetical protein
MAIEIAKFRGLKNFFLVILSELTIKCVIRFDKFSENFRGPMEMLERDHCFQHSVE